MAVAHKSNNKDRYLYLGLGVLLAGAVIGAGFIGYKWYRNAREQAAYKDLSETIEGYTKTLLMGSSSKEAISKWADVQQAFEVGAELHRSSTLYPFFLLYQADILSQQGKTTEALQIMKKALTHMDKHHPLYYLYALKSALMHKDSSDPAQVKEGRELLEKLAQDTANPVQDMALYYSALDARARGDVEAAQKRLQQLTASENEDSIWYKKALNSL